MTAPGMSEEEIAEQAEKSRLSKLPRKELVEIAFGQWPKASRNDWDTPIPSLAKIPPGLPDAPLRGVQLW